MSIAAIYRPTGGLVLASATSHVEQLVTMFSAVTRTRSIWSLALFAGALLAQTALSQEARVRVSIHAVLIDGDLNQKPVPRLAVEFTRGSDSAPLLAMRTGFDGLASGELPVGKYQLSTPQGVVFQGRHYAWRLEVTVNAVQMVVLSNDNAAVATSSSGPISAAPTNDVANVLARLRSSLSSGGTPPSDAANSLGQGQPQTATPSTPSPSPVPNRELLPVLQLVARLDSPAPAERSSATEALIERRDAGVPEVIGALNSTSWQVRGRAAYILGEINTAAAKAAEAKLKKLADSDSNGYVREKSVEAIKKMGLSYQPESSGR